MEVVVKIAFFIPDETDLFGFLETLRPFNLLGPLEDLYKLGLKYERYELWPKLVLKPSHIDSVDRYAFEAIVKYYADVKVVNEWTDIEWLKKNVNRSVKIEWSIAESIPKVKLMDNWIDFRITRLSIVLNDDIASSWWSKIVPRVPHLTSLEAYIIMEYSTNFFECVAASDEIIKLELNIAKYDMTPRNFTHLTRWFRKHPVRKLTCVSEIWRIENKSGMQALYQVMFNCPTLGTLELSKCNLEFVDFTEMVLPMKSLQLCNCGFGSDQFEALVKRLEGSKDTHHFTSDRAQTLALAIRKNKAICDLYLNYGTVDISDLRLLIESMTHPSRCVKRKRIGRTTLLGQEIEPKDFKAMSELTNKRGGVFVSKSEDFVNKSMKL
ncbi:hypothetical protein AC1031_016547 [Aphanomyces cochlioides]|nr:hypothetical protein AC1031_016547 [Aphanomyces cochlioides]